MTGRAIIGQIKTALSNPSLKASNVVIFDSDYNPFNDLQAIARVYRTGQKKPVTVYRFTTRGIDERRVLNIGVSKLGAEEILLQGGYRGVSETTLAEGLSQQRAERSVDADKSEDKSANTDEEDIDKILRKNAMAVVIDGVEVVNSVDKNKNTSRNNDNDITKTVDNVSNINVNNNNNDNTNSKTTTATTVTTKDDDANGKTTTTTTTTTTTNNNTTTTNTNSTTIATIRSNRDVGGQTKEVDVTMRTWFRASNDHCEVNLDANNFWEQLKSVNPRDS